MSAARSCRPRISWSSSRRNIWIAIQPLRFEGVSKMTPTGSGVECIVRVKQGSQVHQIRGSGNGPVAAFVHGLNESKIVEPFEVVSYSEHSLGSGAEAKAVAYFEVKSGPGAGDVRRGDGYQHRDRVAEGGD